MGSYDGYALYSLKKINNTTVGYQIGSESGTATFTKSIPTYGPVSPVFTNSQTFSSTWSVKWFLAVHLSAMPTFTIGTGSVFQANATTTSTFSGLPTGNYNATYVFDAYNIPIAPSTNYVTVIFNSTWRLSNIYPSTYLPSQNNSDFITIEDVSGFSSVQVTLIEPSSQIGSTTYQSIDYQMPSGITPPVNYFTNTITITPFASSSQTTEKTTAQFVQIPYGSSISIDVTDPWGDSVGSISNYVVANTTGSITIHLDVTELQFTFFNSTE